MTRLASRMAWALTVGKLARRELRGGWRSFRIFFFCLLLGVAAIASVGAVRAAFVKGLDGESRSLLGGDLSIALTHRPMAEEERAFVEGWGRVSYTAAMRSMASLKDASQLIELKAVDSAYPLFGAVEMEKGTDFQGALSESDGVFGVVVEETLLSRLGLKLGDLFRIGGAQVMVRDILVNEPDRVAGGFRYGPRVFISEEGLAATGLVQLGSLITYRTRIALADDRLSMEVINAFKSEALTAFPNGAWNISDRRRSAPGVRFFMNRVSMFLTMIGLAALLVGGVGVGNAVSAYLGGKSEVIATLKCLGAEGSTIFAVYLVQVLVMALAAIVAGLAIGASVPWLLGITLKELLPIPVELGLYPSAMVQAIAFGLLVTVIFSLWPLGIAKGRAPAKLFRGLTEEERTWPGYGVLAAILVAIGLLAAIAILTSGYPPFSAVFLVGSVIAMAGLGAVGWGAKALARRLPRLSAPGLRLAIANLHRPGAATVSVVLSMGLGLTLLVTVVLVDGNLSRQIRDQIPEGAPSFFFIDIQKDDVDDFRALVDGYAGPHTLELVPNLRGPLFSLNGVKPDRAAVDPDVRWILNGDRGLTYAAEVPTGSEVVEGEWWPEDYEGPPLISVEEEVARGLDLKIGDMVGISVLGRPIQARVANFRKLEWRAVQFNYVFVYPPSSLAAAPHTWVGNLTLAPDREEEVYRAITQRYRNVTVVRVKEALASINGLLGSLTAGIRVTSLVTLVAGVLVLAGALAAGRRRRLYDAVVLKVLGAKRGFIARAFLLEFTLLGLLTAVIAAGLGTLAAWMTLTLAMETDFVFLPERVGLTVLLAVAITLTFGALGTWSTLSARPAQHLRSE